LISAAIISDALKNKGTARQLIYESYLGYVLTVTRRYGIQSADEVDMVQDIFIEIFSSLERYDSRKGEFKSWLRRIAVNQVLKRKRKNTNMYVVSLEGTSLPIEDSQLGDLDAEYIINEISKLPEGYQTVFNLYEIDGYSHKEIGQQLNITPQTSKSQLSRAKKMLRNKLRKFVAKL